MAGLLRKGLAAEGWAVDVVGDAAGARHAVQSTPYDAVICDIGLPDGSGLDWCRWLREGHLTPVRCLPLATLSPTGRTGPRRRRLPGQTVRLAELAARSGRRCARNPRPTTLVVGELHLDPARHGKTGTPAASRICRRGSLRWLEFTQGGRRGIPHRADHVWDYAYDGCPTVDVYTVTSSSFRRRCTG
jgi:two-component system OmpR family response regulator